MKGSREILMIGVVIAALACAFGILVRTGTREAPKGDHAHSLVAKRPTTEPEASRDSSQGNRRESREGARRHHAVVVLAGGIPVREESIAILDDADHVLLTVLTDDTGAIDFDLAAAHTHLRFRADFLRSAPIQAATAPESVPGGVVDFGIVTIPGSGILFRIEGASVFGDATLSCGARVAYPPEGGPGLYRTQVDARHAHRDVFLEMPSGVKFFSYVSVGNFSERAPESNALEGWRIERYDFRPLCDLKLTLEGVPRLASSESIVRFTGAEADSRTDREWFESVGATGVIETYARLGSQGQVTASLEISDGPPVALVTDRGATSIDCATSSLDPVEPVVAICLVADDGTVIPDVPFSIGFDAEHTGGAATAGFHVVRESTLNSCESLRVSAAGRGEIELTRGGLTSVDAQVFGIPFQRRGTGALTFVAVGDVDPELEIRLRGADGIVAQARPGRDSRSGETHWRFDSLFPGTYDALWSWAATERCERPCADGLVVGSNDRRVEVDPLAVRTLPGAFLDWRETPEALRPSGISVEGQYALVDSSGGFVLRIALPLAARGDVRLPQRMSTVDGAAALSLSSDGDSIVARLRREDLGELALHASLDPNVDDARIEYWIKTPTDNKLCRSGPLASTILPLKPNSVLRIPKASRECVVGCLWSWDSARGGRQSLLGVFEARVGDSDVDVKCKGRFVRFTKLSSEGSFDLTLNWTSPSGYQLACPIGGLDTSEVDGFWCPDAIDTITVRRPAGDVRTISVHASSAVSW